MTVHTVDIIPLGGGTPTFADIAVRNLRANWVLNGPGALEFELPIKASVATEANLEPGQHELRLSRDGVRIWGGYLLAAGVTDRDTVRIGGQGYLWVLGKRLIEVDKLYRTPDAASDQFEIAWNLISTAQARYSHGITRASSTPSGKKRNVTICAWERKPVLDAIVEMADADDGFDFYIGPTPTDAQMRRWTVGYPRLQTDTAVIFDARAGGSVHELTYDIDATEMATEIHVLGSCHNCSGDTRVTMLGAIDPNYGLLQDTLSVDVRDADHQAGLGREELRHRKQGRFSAHAVMLANFPAWGTFTAGDTVTLKADRGFATIDRRMRVTSFELAVTDKIESWSADLDGVIS